MATPTEVIWTAQAEAALDRVHHWIAAKAPTTADRYCDGLFAATNALARHPGRGHPLHEAKLPPDENPYREIHFKRHRSSTPSSPSGYSSLLSSIISNCSISTISGNRDPTSLHQ